MPRETFLSRHFIVNLTIFLTSLYRSVDQSVTRLKVIRYEMGG